MRKLSRPRAAIVHAILVAGSIVFLFPFVWLVTTSLKPIEQTMKMPPEWVPRAYYAPIGGQRVKVVRERQFLPSEIEVELLEGPRAGERLDVPVGAFHDGLVELRQSGEVQRFRAKKLDERFEPFLIVVIEEGKRRGERVLIPASDYSDGKATVDVRVADRTLRMKVPARLERKVGKGWWLVREKFERLPHEKPPMALSTDEVNDWAAFARRLSHPENALAGRLWSLLDDRAREAAKALASGQPPSETTHALTSAINDLLSRRDLFPEAMLANLSLAPEGRELAARDRTRLDNEELPRLNRLVIEALFPGLVPSSAGQRLKPRWDCVPPEAVESRIEPAWWNYQGAIRYTGYHTFHLFGRQFRVPMFLVYFCNTLKVAVLGVIGVTLSSALAAYAFARIRWPGRDAFFIVTLSTMMVPFAVTMVPLYGIFRGLGWIGTLRPLWVPAYFGSAFNIFLLRQFFLTIPQDLSDAARIDGCSEFGIFWRIILPLSKPALAVVALFHFMYAWKDFMGPLIYLQDQHTYTLSLGLQFYQSQHGGSEWHYLMAACTMMVIPIIVLFFFTQRTFIQGISTTGMKG